MVMVCCFTFIIGVAYPLLYLGRPNSSLDFAIRIHDGIQDIDLNTPNT